MNLRNNGEELGQAPKSGAEKSYHKLIYFHEAEKGGQFAQWKQSELFTAELRAAFKSLRYSERSYKWVT
jgi:hypothetical protein